ncbi:MAG: histone H1-like repetitive region-containing protein [Acidimicrobiia bacterium]|nr:histone H1-like repetitive region-containing protein [Acidimicrobiia bacterium]
MATTPKKTPAKKPSTKAAAKKAPAKAAAKKAVAKKPAAKKPPAKAGAKKAPAKKAVAKKAPAKKAVAKKPAAKKPAAKKAPAKKAPAKKAPAKKAAAKKPPAKAGAKKAPARKAPAKKAPAKKAPAKAGAKKAPAKKAPARGRGRKAETTRPVARKPVKIPFKVGDKVVYPHHGAATIVKKEKIEFAGEKQDYFVLELATDQLTVRVPTVNALELGVRPVISQNVARKVFATFRQDPEEAGSNWSRWYKLLTEKINSGDIFQVAEVVRDLTYAQQLKGISPALKRMLAKARLIITSELRFALKIDEEEAIKRLERALPKVDIPEED